MTVPNNLYQTFTANHLREDLAAMINEVSVTDRPIYNALGKTGVDATYKEWTTFSLSSPADNAAVQGADADLDAPEQEAKVGNRTQIFEYAYGVAGTQQVVDKAGSKDELAKQRERFGEKILNDVEYALAANTAQAAGGASTASRLGGLPTWIKTNVNQDAGATASAGTGTDTRTAGSNRGYTEDMLRDVMLQAYSEGGKPKLAIHGAYNRTVASGFKGSSNYVQVDASKRKIFASVKVYESDFGELDIVPSPQANMANTVFFLDPQKAHIGVLRPMKTQKLAKTGDSDKEQIIMEATLIVDNEKAHGAVYDLTSAAA